MKRLACIACLAALTALGRPPAADLGACQKTLAGYAATEADAKAVPMAKAKAKMARLVLEMCVCEDAALDAKIAEARAFVEAGGGLADPDEKVQFLLTVADGGGVFNLPDVERLAAEAAKGHAKATSRYVDLMLRRCRPGREDFTYARSHERRLDIVEAALADPVTEGFRTNLEGKRFAVLRELGRRDEAVKYAEERLAAATSDGTRRFWYGQLAGAYTADARRYAEAPSPALLAKAEEMLVKSGACTKGGLTAEDCLAIARLRLDRGDFAGARAIVLKSRTGKPAERTVRAGELILGAAAFGEEDWSEAADRYLPLFDPKGRNEHDQVVRTVQALFAADRRREAVPLVKWLSMEKGGRYKQSRAKFARILKEIESL